MGKQTYIAQHTVRGLRSPQVVNGSKVEHVVNAGESIELEDSDEVARLVKQNVLVLKPAQAKPADPQK
jgi:hypothetical protein